METLPALSFPSATGDMKRGTLTPPHSSSLIVLIIIVIGCCSSNFIIIVRISLSSSSSSSSSSSKGSKSSAGSTSIRSSKSSSVGRSATAGGVQRQPRPIGRWARHSCETCAAASASVSARAPRWQPGWLHIRDREGGRARVSGPRLGPPAAG
eukprot:scaffold1222_cov330-Prasinococcus_capsulatus_cf.AAC.5